MKRRRCLTILAGASAGALCAASCRGKREAATQWRGVLFNAEVDLVLHDLPKAEAEDAIARCVTEMRRLEDLFSLYLPESGLCRLNREGRLADPPAEFVALVEAALAVAERSEGVFDPTVQPYWLWLRDLVESGRPLDPAEQARQLRKVDYREVQCTGELIRFRRDGMGMTFNGIAQGWITDRVCALLREAGAEHSLVNLGEFYALGTRPSGGDWLVGIRGVEGAEIALRERALAVSSGAGHFFGTRAGRNHLIDPRSGGCAPDRRVVAVTAADACTADALSTACAVLDEEAGRALVNKWQGAELRVFGA